MSKQAKSSGWATGAFDSGPEGASILPHPDTIPKALAEQARWIVWRPEPRPKGRVSKVPLHPETGRRHDAADPAIWMSLSEAVGVWHVDPRVGGIGFVLNGSHVVVVDLDRALDGGQIKPWALEVVQRMPLTVWERSVSGDGLHGYTIGQWRGVERDRAIEVKRRGFAVVTGALLPGSATELARDQAGLEWLRAERMVIAEARARDPEFRRLWRGDRSGYPSDSEADYALALKLAGWLRGDQQRIVTEMLRSKLWREKWRDRPQWLEHVVAKAVSEWRHAQAIREIEARTDPVQRLRRAGGRATPVNVAVLEFLAQSPDSISPAALAQVTGQRPDSVRRALRSLHRLGILTQDISGYCLAAPELLAQLPASPDNANAPDWNQAARTEPPNGDHLYTHALTPQLIATGLSTKFGQDGRELT